MNIETSQTMADSDQSSSSTMSITVPLITYRFFTVIEVNMPKVQKRGYV